MFKTNKIFSLMVILSVLNILDLALTKFALSVFSTIVELNPLYYIANFDIIKILIPLIYVPLTLKLPQKVNKRVVIIALKIMVIFYFHIVLWNINGLLMGYIYGF